MSNAQRLRGEDGAPTAGPVVEVLGWGCAQLPSERIAELRRSLPSWAPPNTANHFFKYADEQTLLAVQAVDDALKGCGMDPAELTTWGIIGAPQFLGRQIIAYSIDQYSRSGGQRVSPHVVPQNSLHSVSGSLSILLATHGPNLGIGGSRDALTEGLFAALTLLDFQRSPGCWLVATGWNPEPIPDRQGQGVTPGVCHAAALAVRPATESSPSHGQLSLSNGLRIFSPESPPRLTLPDLVSSLRLLDDEGGSKSFSWRLPWGGSLDLALTARAVRARQAA